MDRGGEKISRCFQGGDLVLYPRVYDPEVPLLVVDLWYYSTHAGVNYALVRFLAPNGVLYSANSASFTLDQPHLGGES